MKYSIITVLALGLLVFSLHAASAQGRRSFSGIYPHLAYYNNEGECGTGAVVPWAGKLWVITYGPHLPFGSSDKLYEITPALEQIVRPESIGGTPANRLIHRESNQLFIGPYAIDAAGKVRVIPYTQAQGRHTGNARHLTDPANRLYIGTMEEGFYDVDVHTLASKELYADGNAQEGKHDDTAVNPQGMLLPGSHGKGLYSGQGVVVYSNNGEATKEAQRKFDVEAGVLAEWNGKDWQIVRRNQFVEVTGPGGIYGNDKTTDPIWATGWDHKSVLVGVRGDNAWAFYRLPKASHSYDGAHGWNTEWPRIRNVGTDTKPDYLMTMHGLFWNFPGTFSRANTAGIRPRSAYLKVIGDYTRWNDQLVFGCDDSAQKEFLNKRKVKGAIEGPGQSNSNLWFTPLDQPDKLGPATAEGAVWLSDNVEAGKPSEPFLFAGWSSRMAWVNNAGNIAVNFTFEVDQAGNGRWTKLRTVPVAAGSSASVIFSTADKGEWIRVWTDQPTQATVHFSYTDGSRYYGATPSLTAGIANAGSKSYTGGLLYGLGDNRRALGVLAGTVANNTFLEAGYYELTADMALVPKTDATTADFIRTRFAIPQQVVTIDEASVLIVDDNGRRWRLPMGDAVQTTLIQNNVTRICREVATERDLLNVHGTFYELPAENADGFAKIRPVASHGFAIHDYASYRGLLVMTGLLANAANPDHIVTSADGKARVWAGTIDDLWKLGKPVGQGGPWKNSAVQAGEASDPYLIGFYDKRSLKLSHRTKEPIVFTIEVEPVGHGPWMTYKTVTVPPGKTVEEVFPEGFQSRWIRFKASKDCQATAWLTYQ